MPKNVILLQKSHLAINRLELNKKYVSPASLITANIAEDLARRYTEEYVRFLKIAQGFN